MSTSGESSNKWSSPSERPRHKHPARGARIAALVASVGATGALGVAFARSATSDDVTLAAAQTQPGATDAAITADAAVTAGNPTTPQADATNTEPDYERHDDDAYEGEGGDDAYEGEGNYDDDYERHDDEGYYEDDDFGPPPGGFPGGFPDGATPPAMPDNIGQAPTQQDPTQQSPAAGTGDTQTQTTGALNDGTYTGSSQRIPWGPVQVRVTVSNGKVANIETLAVPMSRKSGQINSRAVPVLQSQAIARQSASLDTISGATWTSRAYAVSLQAALDASSTGSANAAAGAAA